MEFRIISWKFYCVSFSILETTDWRLTGPWLVHRNMQRTRMKKIYKTFTDVNLLKVCGTCTGICFLVQEIAHACSLHFQMVHAIGPPAQCLVPNS